jgi:putative transcriptional regulator
MDAGAHEMAERDPDARAMTEEEFARAERVPHIKTLCHALGLTREEFAARYKIPLGILRNWGWATPPDRAARAVLHVTAHDPGGVRRAWRASTVGACLNFAKRSEN